MFVFAMCCYVTSLGLTIDYSSSLPPDKRGIHLVNYPSSGYFPRLQACSRYTLSQVSGQPNPVPFVKTLTGPLCSSAGTRENVFASFSSLKSKITFPFFHFFRFSIFPKFNRKNHIATHAFPYRLLSWHYHGPT